VAQWRLIVCPLLIGGDHQNGVPVNAVSPIVFPYSHRSFKCQTVEDKERQKENDASNSKEGIFIPPIHRR